MKCLYHSFVFCSFSFGFGFSFSAESCFRSPEFPEEAWSRRCLPDCCYGGPLKIKYNT